MNRAAIAEFHDLSLQPHPSGGAGPLRALSVSGALDAAGTITLDYLLQGDLLRLRLPETARSPQRRDELWRHTCMELFARHGGAEAYLEFNFSPSGDWAAYRFAAYREARTALEQHGVGITVQPLGPGQLRIQARVQLPAVIMASAADPALSELPSGPQPAGWHLGPAAVIEADDGTRSYWACRHAGAQPDFHAAENFGLRLAPAAAALRSGAGAR